ncbi:MAG TPA: transposase, partial [Kofleriaceae bacterium]|nr:transposase [Kofleriaceae bacterium]
MCTRRSTEPRSRLRERFRIVHVSIQRNHVHMLVEAEHKTALARGMQGFQISAARHINTALGDRVRRRRGQVFADRYHLEVISSPTRARHAIAYVLGNWRKHREDRGPLSSTWRVDPAELRSARGVPAEDVAAPRGLEACRACDQ